MPIGLLGGQLLANTASTVTNQYLNNINYNRQRQDALSDWQRDVAYNSPSAQVARLQAAGISPYANSGQSLLSTAPNTRQSTMSQGTSQPISALSVMQGIEQLKLMRLQQEKTQSETASIDADVKNKTLAYDADFPYLKSKKQWEVDELMNRVDNIAQQSHRTAQETENLRASNAGITANSDIAQIEKLFRSDLLAGKNDLQRGQIHKLMLENYAQEASNKYSTSNEAHKNSLLGSEAAIRKQDAELSNVLPASVRYFLEKMGGNDAASMATKRMMLVLMRKFVGY